jgi:hypothetical protein
VDLTSTATWTGSLADYANLWRGASGCGFGAGPEIWVTATVAPGNLFELAETTTTDVEIDRVAACGTTTCSWTTDSSEQFSYLNDTAAPVTVFLVVEGYYSYTVGTVTLTASNAAPPAGSTCANPIDLTAGGTWSGNFSSFRDGWTRGTGCGGMGTGPEVWFTALVAAGGTFTFSETSTTDVVLHRVSACGTTSCTWYGDEPETLSWTNSTGAAATVYLNLERYISGTTGAINVTSTNTP